MLLKHCIASNVGEQDSSGNRNCNNQGRGSGGRSQSRNFSGGRGRGNHCKRNNMIIPTERTTPIARMTTTTMGTVHPNPRSNFLPRISRVEQKMHFAHKSKMIAC